VVAAVAVINDEIEDAAVGVPIILDPLILNPAGNAFAE
jgi:hypothetical protein